MARSPLRIGVGGSGPPASQRREWSCGSVLWPQPTVSWRASRGWWSADLTPPVECHRHLGVLKQEARAAAEV